MSNESTHYRLRIRKEALKFSAAHMTVFPDGTKENLHGHNYRTELAVDFARCTLKDMIPFKAFKDAMRKICREWDEKLLLAANCPHFKIVGEKGGELEFTLCKKRYIVPRDEVELLPVDNIITETLAAEFSRRLVAALDPKVLDEQVLRLEVRIEEMLGQGASFIRERKKP